MNGSWLALGAAGALALAAETRRRGFAAVDPSYPSWLAAWESWAKEGGRFDVPGLSYAEREKFVQVDWCMENAQTDLTRGSIWANRFSIEQRRGDPRRIGAPALGKPDLGRGPLPPGWHWPRWAWHDGPRAVRRMYAKLENHPDVSYRTLSYRAHVPQSNIPATPGEIIEINTQFLFHHRFHTSDPPRILLASSIAKLFNDARIGRGVCWSCKNTTPDVHRGCALCVKKENAISAQRDGIEPFLYPSHPLAPRWMREMGKRGDAPIGLPRTKRIRKLDNSGNT